MRITSDTTYVWYLLKNKTPEVQIKQKKMLFSFAYHMLVTFNLGRILGLSVL